MINCIEPLTVSLYGVGPLGYSIFIKVSIKYENILGVIIIVFGSFLDRLIQLSHFYIVFDKYVQIFGSFLFEPQNLRNSIVITL